MVNGAGIQCSTVGQELGNGSADKWICRKASEEKDRVMAIKEGKVSPCSPESRATEQ